jgi:hypothetical protein
VTDSASIKRCPCPEHEGPNPLPVSEFSRGSSNRDGLKSWCKTCVSRQQARYREANREAIRERERRRYQADRENERERSRRYHRANPGQNRDRLRRWRKANPGAGARQARRQHQAARDAVLDHYGRSCACCGSAEDLGIDHVNGGGNAHRIALFGRAAESTKMYRWLIRNGFPAGYQILCGPCNSSKAGGAACRLDHAA